MYQTHRKPPADLPKISISTILSFPVGQNVIE